MTNVTEKIRELRKLVKCSIAERMRSRGFAKYRSGTYYRNEAYGRSGFTCSLSSYGETLKIEVSASIKIDQVENILFEYQNSVPDKFEPPNRPSEFTVSRNLGNVRGGGWKQWFVYGAEDVQQTISEIDIMVASVGVPFLDRFGSPELLMSEMASAFTQPSVLGSPVFFYDRFFILACVLNRCDLFNQVRPVFEQRVQNNEQTPLTRVVPFLDWLSAKFCRPLRTSGA